MSLKDYTTEELKAELKRRSDLAKTEKARVKRCRMCKHWGVVDYKGKPLSESEIEWRKKLNYSKPCKFFCASRGNISSATSPRSLLVNTLNRLLTKYED